MTMAKLILLDIVLVLSSLSSAQRIPFDEETDPGEPLAPLCEPDAPVPDDLIQCGTCQNRCGTTANPNSIQSRSPGWQCSCDTFCGFHGDCCQDFQTFCAQQFQDFRQASELYPFTRTRREFQCRRFTTGFSRSVENQMIDTCPDASECEFTPELNENVNTFVPMYDIHRGVHYISGQCALCNGATDVIPWQVTLDCNPVRDPKDYIATGVVNSTESLSDIKDAGVCDMYYSISGESRPCHPGRMISSCPSSCQNQQLVSLCESGSPAYTVLNGVFWNVYCAICNAHEDATSGFLTCGYDGRLPSIVPEKRPRPEGSFSLTLVFDFDPSKGLTVGQHEPDCEEGEIYVPDEDACRAITCPSGFVLEGTYCIPEPSNITVTITVTFSEEPSAQVVEILNQKKSNLETSTKEGIVVVMETFNVTQHNLELEAQFLSFEQESLVTEIITSCNCDYSSLFLKPGTLENFEEVYLTTIRKEFLEYSSENGVSFSSVTFDVDLEINGTLGSDIPQVDCTWLVYQPNETNFNNGNITVVSTGRTYDSGKFQILEDSVIVCETDLGGPGEDDDDVDLALSILTLILVGISIICLVIRVVLQYFISSFKSRPGRLQLQLTIAFLIAFIMLIVGVLVRNTPEACTTAGVLLAYGFLAAFIWMNVIAVDTWLVFRPSAAFSRSDEEYRSLAVHYILGWGIPLLLVTVSIATNYTEVDDEFQSDFGGTRCWYTKRYAMLCYFGVPIALSIILNTILYIVTSINLHKAFKNATNVIKAEGYHFGVYVRLFILMGITWIFGFISAFTDEVVIDFIFVILTSLQGLFLFISFVCNRRVLGEVGRKLKSETSSTSGRTTKSTPVPSFDSSAKSDTQV